MLVFICWRSSSILLLRLRRILFFRSFSASVRSVWMACSYFAGFSDLLRLPPSLLSSHLSTLNRRSLVSPMVLSWPICFRNWDFIRSSFCLFRFRSSGLTNFTFILARLLSSAGFHYLPVRLSLPMSVFLSCRYGPCNIAAG